MNRLANSRIRATATDIPGHRFINVRVRRLRILRQQDCRAHDLSRLAIAALRHVNFDPGFL